MIRNSESDKTFDLADLIEEDGDEQMPYLPLLGRPGYFVQGWTHILSAYPRIGKTELLTTVVEEWLLMGKAVLWISEEPRLIWKLRVKKRGSFPRGLRVHLGYASRPEELLTIMIAAKETIVIVDTIRNLLQPRDETDNSEMARVLKPWIAAREAKGSTLIFVHHNRKGGGEHGEGISGGHAILGAIDIALEMTPHKRDKTKRVIQARARLVQPPDLLFSYDSDTGIITPDGDPADLGVVPMEGRILDNIRGPAWIKTIDIEKGLAANGPRPSRDQVTKVLTNLTAQGRMERDPALGSEAAGRTVKWRKVFDAGEWDVAA